MNFYKNWKQEEEEITFGSPLQLPRTNCRMLIEGLLSVFYQISAFLVVLHEREHQWGYLQNYYDKYLTVCETIELNIRDYFTT